MRLKNDDIKINNFLRRMKENLRKFPIFFSLVKASYSFGKLTSYTFLRIVYRSYPKWGVLRYQSMQQKEYQRYTATYEESIALCVGQYQAHQSYPYEEYLLQHYSGPRTRALDFACGVGRMMVRMSGFFDEIDGIDLSQNNLNYARRYMLEKGVDPNKSKLFLSDGISVSINGHEKYDFIYSTIALQHICVHRIRLGIITGLFGLLRQGGGCCFQMGFGWDNGVHYFDDNFVAESTNAGCDISIPNSSHLKSITDEMTLIGFSEVKYEFKLSPHPEFGNTYHPIWLFIHLRK
jgi:SAM-dependent methyltransferase